MSGKYNEFSRRGLRMGTRRAEGRTVFSKGAPSFFDNFLLTRISRVRKTDSQAGDDVPSAPSPCWFRPHPEKTSGGLYDQFSSA